jgi:hypothetical protein
MARHSFPPGLSGGREGTWKKIIKASRLLAHETGGIGLFALTEF